MKKKIIGANIEPKCEYCKCGIDVNDADTLLCRHVGITTKDAKCKKFRYDPLKRKPTQAPALMQFTDQDFSLE